MTELDQLRRLVMLLQAIADVEKERAQISASIEAELEKLIKQVNELRYEILTGQQAIQMEPFEKG